MNENNIAYDISILSIFVKFLGLELDLGYNHKPSRIQRKNEQKNGIYNGYLHMKYIKWLKLYN